MTNSVAIVKKQYIYSGEQCLYRAQNRFFHRAEAIRDPPPLAQYIIMSLFTVGKRGAQYIIRRDLQCKENFYEFYARALVTHQT
jgi:hypothetical protein